MILRAFVQNIGNSYLANTLPFHLGPVTSAKFDYYGLVVISLTISPEYVIPHCYGDRFIPRRYAINRLNINDTSFAKFGPEDVMTTKFSSNHWRRKNLKLAMNNSFGIKHRRILEFSDISAKSVFTPAAELELMSSGFESIYGKLIGYDWPCRPRTKPMASVATTHNLPNFDYFTDLNLIDWSVDGAIAASFRRDLVLWKPSQGVTLVYGIRNSVSIAFSPQGEYIAVAGKSRGWPDISLWDLKDHKRLIVHSYYIFDKPDAVVYCMEWDKTGKTLVCGTAIGWTYIFKAPDLSVVKVLTNHTKAIFMIKFSPDMRYLATSDIEGFVYVYKWPSHDLQVVSGSKQKRRVVIDWHPWNGTDLAISEGSPGSIVILHVPSKKIVAYFQRNDKDIEINYITFNKLTAELIVCYCKLEPNSCFRSEILVMSSLDHVVDVLCLPDSCVRFMMWSADGTQLATASDDDTLTIWNFVPKNFKATETCVKVQRQKNTEFDMGCCRGFTKWSINR